MNDGRFIVEAAANAVANAMEHVEDADASLVFVQILAVWDTDSGPQITTHMAEIE